MVDDDNLAKVQRALRLAETDGDDSRKADLRENVGDVYLNADNCDQALVYYQKIRSSRKWHSFDTEEKARIWHKMALAHDGKGDLEQALRLATQAERALDREGDSPLLGKIYSLAGRLNRKLGNHRDALAYSLRALILLRNSPENREIADVQLTAGSIFLRQGKFDEAVRYFQDSLSTYRRIDDEQ
jgi:tetratricopeptide (TPR) repeat protein